MLFISFYHSNAIFYRNILKMDIGSLPRRTSEDQKYINSSIQVVDLENGESNNNRSVIVPPLLRSLRAIVVELSHENRSCFIYPQLKMSGDLL